MAYKAVSWNKAKARKKLSVRLRDAKKHRKRFENQWRENEITIFNATGVMQEEGGSLSVGRITSQDIANAINSGSDDNIVGVNYAFKHYRFIHAQLSSNPPSVIPRPTSSDPSDRRKADAADRLVRHAIRGYNMQETVDLTSGKTLLYGTGWLKTLFNENGGDILQFDEETREVHMEGDLEMSSPSTWDMWIDPQAKTWDQVRYVIERKWFDEDEMDATFPEHSDLFHKIIEDTATNKKSYAEDQRELMEEEKVPVYCYWEKGMPINGMAGRFVYFLEDGTPLTDVRKNPFRFSAPLSKEERMEQLEAEKRGQEYEVGPETAYLPFHILTDIDVTDQVYGKSFVEYEARIQDIMNRLDSVTLDNIQAHGVLRLILPEGCDIADDSLCDTPYEVIKTTGAMKPHFMSAPSLMPETSSLRDRLQAGGDDMAGVNDSMFGKQEREQSGFSMQYATNQGNLIRRRLFNKYVMFVESIYKSYINLVRKHWNEGKIIQVLGKEQAFESIEIKGADVDGGFDFVVEYGASLSLDPASRREEIMQLMPIFEKYGVDGKSILSMLKLNELEGILDLNSLSRHRQQEVVEEMITKNVYIEPKPNQEHDGMLAYLYTFVMTSEYRDLSNDQKALVDRHMEDREAIKAQSLGTPGLQEANVGANPPGPTGELGLMPEGTGPADIGMETAPLPMA